MRTSVWVNVVFSGPGGQDVLVHEFATLCLASLSADDDCRAKIVDCEGLPTLIQLLSSPDDDVQMNSLEIIYNLVQVAADTWGKR